MPSTVTTSTRYLTKLMTKPVMYEESYSNLSRLASLNAAFFIDFPSVQIVQWTETSLDLSSQSLHEKKSVLLGKLPTLSAIRKMTVFPKTVHAEIKPILDSSTIDRRKSIKQWKCQSWNFVIPMERRWHFWDMPIYWEIWIAIQAFVSLKKTTVGLDPLPRNQCNNAVTDNNGILPDWTMTSNADLDYGRRTLSRTFGIGYWLFELWWRLQICITITPLSTFTLNTTRHWALVPPCAIPPALSFHHIPVMADGISYAWRLNTIIKNMKWSCDSSEIMEY